MSVLGVTIILQVQVFVEWEIRCRDLNFQECALQT